MINLISRFKCVPIYLAFAILIANSFFCLTGRAQSTNALVIQSITVDGKGVAVDPSSQVNLGIRPKDVLFEFQFRHPDLQPPLRLRARLEGFEHSWHEGGEGNMMMYLSVRFFSAKGNQIGQKIFPITGHSAGWTGSVKTSPLVSRRQTVVVPPGAHSAWVVICSAGSPTVVGIYAVANLRLTETSQNSPDRVLIDSPLDNLGDKDRPPGWERDGTHMDMAKIIEIGLSPPRRAFAIEDDDAEAHAEWHNSWPDAPIVTPGNNLVVEWNEMYSTGVADMRYMGYPDLPPGNYRFEIAGLDLSGMPNGLETSVEIFVPKPFWSRPSSWVIVGIGFVLITAAMSRYYIWQRMRKETQYWKYQQATERERLQIARDIHDDLGAKITCISMVSATSLHDPNLSDATRAELNQIRQMSKDLISALYETVWTVNPKNDNLDELGNYLGQVVGKLCKETRLQCRFHIADLPSNVPMSSHMRHNITMATKEAIHNVIKHAKASEIELNITAAGDLTIITITDDGCGFQPEGVNCGYGLTNMQRRLAEMGGECAIESKPGFGTTVRFRFAIPKILKEVLAAE
jgi:signal transduction histidine kinase